MKTVVLAMTVLALTSLGCREGDEVALNARQFDLQSMEFVGAGCTVYRLGSGENIETAAGNVDGTGLTVRERLIEDEVVIDVEHGSAVVVTKRYGLSFFSAGAVDEFTVARDATTGLFFRYWGTLHPGGPEGCTPLDADGPT
jgi:outer membrane lipoprotein SlyB